MGRHRLQDVIHRLEDKNQGISGDRSLPVKIRLKHVIVNPKDLSRQENERCNKDGKAISSKHHKGPRMFHRTEIYRRLVNVLLLAGQSRRLGQLRSDIPRPERQLDNNFLQVREYSIFVGQVRNL